RPAPPLGVEPTEPAAPPVIMTLSPAPTAATAPPPTLAVPAPAPAPAARSAANTRRLAGYVAGGLGLAALAAGGALYLNARSDWHAAIDRGCTTSGCPADAAPYWDDARGGVTASRIVAGGGALLLAAAAALLLSARW